MVKNLKLAKSALLDFHGVNVPDEFLASVIEDDPFLLDEVELGDIRDGVPRKELLNAVSNALGVGDWPTYLELQMGKKVNFFPELRKVLGEIGGSYCNNLN